MPHIVHVQAYKVRRAVHEVLFVRGPGGIFVGHLIGRNQA